MGPVQLLRWQWDGYPRYRLSRANLLLHIVAVPVFLIGNIGLLVALFLGSWAAGTLSLLGVLASVALQGRGHKLEQNPPQPFTGPTNAAARILLEQWITFPRFVITGGWSRALRTTSPR